MEDATCDGENAGSTNCKRGEAERGVVCSSGAWQPFMDNHLKNKNKSKQAWQTFTVQREEERKQKPATDTL